MTASLKSAKCVQCNAPVVGNSLLCQSCQAHKPAGKPGGAASPSLSQPSPTPTPPLSPVTHPHKKRVLSRATLASAVFVLCIFGTAYYIVELRIQTEASRQELAEYRKREQPAGGSVLPRKKRPRQGREEQMVPGSFVFVDAATELTETLDFKENNSYTQTTRQGQNTNASPGVYKLNGQQITLQGVDGKSYSGNVSGNVVTIDWGTRSIPYTRAEALAEEQSTPIAPSGRGQRSYNPPNEADENIKAAGYDAIHTYSAARNEFVRLVRQVASTGVRPNVDITPYRQQMDRDAATIRQNIPYTSDAGQRVAQGWLDSIQHYKDELAQYNPDGPPRPAKGSVIKKWTVDIGS